MAEENDKEVKEEKKGKDKRQKQKPITSKVTKSSFTHKYLACHLKMHTGRVTGFDWSFNEKLVATTGDDRSIGLWILQGVRDEDNKQPLKSIKVNVELDDAVKIRFYPDDKAFFVNLYNDNSIRGFKITKKDKGSYTATAALDFKTGHEGEITDMGISSNGKFLFTSDNGTNIRVWAPKGELLESIDSKQIKNNHTAVSTCGRFIATCGFTPDVKVWEVVFTKNGEFQQVVRAFELKGHRAAVYNFSFSAGTERMATVSKDGTWRLWDTNVDYKQQQDPYLLQTRELDGITFSSRIALTPDGLTVAITRGGSISIFSAKNGELLEEIRDIFAGDITEISFSRDGMFLGACGDRVLSLFHNIPGVRAKIKDFEELNKKATGALAERLRKQIKECSKKLEKYE
ncbi:DgyrCDS11434 [Dimorphilus gyrociliatus]|uniref:DgyrCDS11434 n=1 Tax=Dimorphilus gyrociliatus TaxID=2664684 RepID=A0A7I8W7X7_9ANNE|nr:DgyrCDS11434 [Dimorphilus gyrociliatus]